MNAAAWPAILEASTLGQWMRNAPWAYPAANVLHVLGLTVLVGPVLLLDLRLLGAGRKFPLEATARVLTAWSAAGLLVMIGSGTALFAADAVALSASAVMHWKFGLIGAGVANALAFRWLWAARLEQWDRAPPPLGRAQAGVSIVLWLAVPVAGRLIAYL